MAYYAMQNVATVFDHSLVRIKGLRPTYNINSKNHANKNLYNKSTDRSISVYGYQHATTN